MAMTSQPREGLEECDDSVCVCPCLSPGKASTRGQCDPAKRRDPRGAPLSPPDLWLGPPTFPTPHQPQEEEEEALPPVLLPAWPVDLPLRFMRLQPAPFHDKRKGLLLPSEGEAGEYEGSPVTRPAYMKRLGGAQQATGSKQTPPPPCVRTVLLADWSSRPHVISWQPE